jgi:hypothetical protein
MKEINIKVLLIIKPHRILLQTLTLHHKHLKVAHKIINQ